jgi:hypothetical protein
MMHSCNCDGLAGSFYLDEAPVGWLEGLQQMATGNWKMLSRCPGCGRTFSVDAWDKFHDQVVVRVSDRSNWEEQGDSVEVRKSLLLRSRGGLDRGACICLNCLSPRVQGVVYCLDHLWETGARR